MQTKGGMDNVHQGHRKRVKEEFRENGLSHFPPHKVLELLLYYAIPRGDTNVIGHRLMERFGSLSGVFDASPELLCEVDGIGVEAAAYLKLLSATVKVYLDDLMATENTLEDVEAAKRYMMHKFLGETVECLYFTGLGHNGRVIFCTKLSEGTPETVSISPASIIKAALRADAARVILAHNHPHGFCNPSNADLQTTAYLHKELLRVDVRLQDHIIVASDGICSMWEQGMMPDSRGYAGNS